ncbi:MAG: flippase-like domain-containing protein [Bacteroidales bacterium]|nr:flippase-like domain-containing protein [Bacteroidales bacterium]MBN2756986.1 flippase-like domain-containing protein [Bacteroidales bacterium]
MKRAKNILRVLLYLSVFVVIYYLYRFDYLVISLIKFNFLYLFISVVLLWLGFYISTLSWQKSLKVYNINISKSLAVYSHGISVFAKYIPGKIWVILGRASIVSEKEYLLSQTASVSLKEQLVYLFTGLVISCIILPLANIDLIILFFVYISTIVLGIFLFNKIVHEKLILLLEKLFKKKLDIPYINIRKSFPYYLYIIIYWLIWSFAFYFFVKSILPDTLLITAFFFPVSVSYGLIAIIVPGGIGVRESIIALLLTSIGVDASLAISISVIQRLWFIFGEVFIFTLALIVKNKAI